MALQICEGCRTALPPDSYDLFDYCAICFRNLCDACMEKGCCEHKPAKSGIREHQDDDTETEKDTDG